MNNEGNKIMNLNQLTIHRAFQPKMVLTYCMLVLCFENFLHI